MQGYDGRTAKGNAGICKGAAGRGREMEKGSRSKQVAAAGQMQMQNEMGPMAWQGQFGPQHYILGVAGAGNVGL